MGVDENYKTIYISPRKSIYSALHGLGIDFTSLVITK